MYYITRFVTDLSKGQVKGAYVKDTKDLVEEYVPLGRLYALDSKGVWIDGLVMLPNYLFPRPKNANPKLMMVLGINVELDKEGKIVQSIFLKKGARCDLTKFPPLADYSVGEGKGIFYFSHDCELNAMAFANFFVNTRHEDEDFYACVDVTNLSEEHSYDLYYTYPTWHTCWVYNNYSLDGCLHVFDDNEARKRCGKIYAEWYRRNSRFPDMMPKVSMLYEDASLDLAVLNKAVESLAKAAINRTDKRRIPKFMHHIVKDFRGYEWYVFGERRGYEAFIDYIAAAKNEGRMKDALDAVNKIIGYSKNVESVYMFVHLLKLWLLGCDSPSFLAILKEFDKTLRNR